AVYNIGWSFNVNGARGKSFRAGDVLVFKYIKGQHNVVAVNGRGYASCSAPRGARTYSSGQDRIKLTRGQNYFICSFPGHCGGGMKIAINAK
nr:Chain A, PLANTACYANIN [Spinacia oleracea]1F56_B Chain B, PLANTACYANIN [Spinacia oleracea]1F56_C Chain C, PLANTACYANIN [Spinacia oleracea]